MENIASPDFKANPFPYYAKLRAESPVVRVSLPDGQTAWLITRYEDVVAVFKDERFVKDKRNAMSLEQLGKQQWVPAFARPLERNMLDLDAEDHARLRALVSKAFTPRLVEAMRPRIECLTSELLDKAERKGRRMDLIADFALPIPTTIIAEMLGVPACDRRRFHRWSGAVVSANASKWGMLWAIPNIWFFLRFIRKLIRLRRNDPHDDLTSALVQAEEAGKRFDEEELQSMIFLLLIAGHETTVNLIGNGMLALLQHPDQLAKLREDAGLIKSAVEELLRIGSPVETGTERFAREDVVIAGVTIPKGALVYAVIASANRDERQFPDPNKL